MALLEEHGRRWRGPEAGIFFERDPAPAVIAFCEAQGVAFEDPDFNPNGSFPDAVAEPSSPLARRSASADAYCSVFWPGPSFVDGGAWRRFRNVAEGCEPKVYDRLSITDVDQGGLSNCWLCATVCAAIQAAPDVVASMVSPAEPNDQGCYSVRLFVEGRPLYVPVDDRVFCAHGALFDMHSRQAHEMYVPLIAKALAKWLTWYDLNGDDRDRRADGNARTVDEGCHLYCLKALTGSDSHGGLAKHVLQWTGDDPWAVSRDAAPDLLRAVFGRGCACTCGGAGEGGASGGVRSFFKGSDSGLVDSHAYTVIWHGDAAGVELVQLRNPWGGDGEWTGDWSDGSPLWSERPEVKAALDAIRADASLARRPFDDGRENDGIFFMAFGDFVKEFQHVEHVDPPFGGVAQAARAQFLLDQAGKPSAQWRIRPPVESVSRWDVSGLRFFDAAGAEIAPTGAVESGSAADAKYDNNPGWDAHSMLFSGEEGACCGVRADDECGTWVGGRFDPPAAVAAVTFNQDDFTEVLLEKHDPESDTWLLARTLTDVALVEAY